MSAEISCGSIVVRGDVSGNVKAKASVELHNPAKVHGDISTPSFMIEKGVIFQGQSKMENLEKELPRYEASLTKMHRNGPGAQAANAEVVS